MDYLMGLNKHILVMIAFYRIALVGLWFFLLFLVAKKNSPKYLLLAVILLGSLSIIFDFSFLKIGYAMWPDGSGDRIAYLGHAMTYAVGNSFGEDAVIKGAPTMLSPIYAYLAALLHRITRYPLIKIYNYGSLLWTIFLPIAFYLFRPTQVNDKDSTDKKWEAILMACFALYLSSDIQDLRFFREDFWNLLVLLKPSHSLSFILIPLLFYFLSKSPAFKYVLISGLLLSFIFVSWPVTGIFLICSFIPFLLFIFFLKRGEFIKVLVQILGTTFIGIALSSWYWYPFFVYKDLGLKSVFHVGFTYEKYNNLIFDPLESTFFMIPLFWLGIAGLYFMFKRKTKFDLLVVGLITAMYLGKFVYPITIAAFNFGPQAFECIVFFIRFSMGLAAGIGFYQIVKIFTEQTIVSVTRDQKSIVDSFFKRASAVKKINFKTSGAWLSVGLLILTPYLIPIWQVPFLNSKWYVGLRDIAPEVIDCTNWIKNNTKYNSVFLSDSSTAMWVSALTGRKLMLDDKGGRNFRIDFVKRKEMANKILKAKKFDKELIKMIKDYDLSYIIITQRLRQEYDELNLEKFKTDNSLTKKVYDKNGYVIFCFVGQ